MPPNELSCRPQAAAKHALCSLSAPHLRARDHRGLKLRDRVRQCEMVYFFGRGRIGVTHGKVVAVSTSRFTGITTYTVLCSTESGVDGSGWIWQQDNGAKRSSLSCRARLCAEKQACHYSPKSHTPTRLSSLSLHAVRTMTA